MFKKFIKLSSLAFSLTALCSTSSFASKTISIVGSSTVYPFSKIVAEEFARGGKQTYPVIESTGTGAGFKLFCGGVGAKFPDIQNASRSIKASEAEMCNQNGVKNITELKIGFDGIVLANNSRTPKLNLTKEQLFLALAKQVPENGKLVDNKYENWSDIDKSLPSSKIEVYGPPASSGTRDAFSEMVMDEFCEKVPEYTAAFPNKNERKEKCHQLREDGAYKEFGEDDDVIVQKLNANPNALGIFGYSFLEANKGYLQGSSIDGVTPSSDTIQTGEYKISRPLFIYVKNDHISSTVGLRDFVKEFTSVKTIGTAGYLTMKGLIPMDEKDLKEVEAKVEGLLK